MYGTSKLLLSVMVHWLNAFGKSNLFFLSFQSALVSNIYFISQMLSVKFGGHFFVRLLGTWEVNYYISIQFHSASNNPGFKPHESLFTK